MRKSEDAWPTKVVNDKHTGYDEMKRSGRLQNTNPTILIRTENSSVSVFIAVTDNEENFSLKPRNYASLLRLKRVLAWVNRFVDNCRKQKEYRTSGELLSDELERAEVQLIRRTQFTRAVHLEMTYGLDTDSFLNAFYRMASRRGLSNRGNFLRQRD